MVGTRAKKLIKKWCPHSSKAVGRCGRHGKQPGKNRVQEQAPGSAGYQGGQLRGWEPENFLPWVEMPPLHFEGTRTNRGQGEARSRKRILTGGDFTEGLIAVEDMQACLYYLLTVLVDQALNELEPTCSSKSGAQSQGTDNVMVLGPNVICIHDQFCDFGKIT